MLYSALAFLAGICVFQLCSSVPAPAWQWLAVAVLCVVFPAPWLRALGFAVGGFMWCWWNAGQVMDMQLPAALEGRDTLVQGTVLGLPEQVDAKRVRFRYRVERVRMQGRWQALELVTRLSWYRGSPALVPGERWQLLLRLKSPHGFANPGTFDYERWLFAQRIRASGYVRDATGNHRLSLASGLWVQRLRRHLSARLRSQDIAQPTEALLQALGIGDRSAMSADQWRVLQRTGTSHLLAISGLHVGLVAGLVFFVVRKAWSLGGDPQRWPAPKTAALCAMLTALAYALLAGFQVPAQRALVMVWVWMLAILCTGRAHPWRAWSVALWIVLLLDPLSVLGAGLWLSFSAVALILLLTAGRYGRRRRLTRVLTVQLGLVAGLTPLLWLWFHQVSLVAPVANLLAIPWVGLLVVPLLLLGLFCLPWWPAAGAWLLSRCADLLSALWWLLEHLASLPLNVWQAPALPAVWMAVFCLGLGCLLLPRVLSLTLVGALISLPVLLLKPERPASGDLWFTLLDVGQGLAAVLETRNHVLVFDAGPAFRSGFDTGDAVLAPYLLQRGYAHVDRLVISHADNDHVGGGRSLFEQLSIDRIQSGEPARIEWARADACHAGRPWLWDRVVFQYLTPFNTGQGNNSSCVLRVETADGRVLLLPGDIERKAERALLAAQRERLAADILVAPHHGSLTSSSQAFVDAVRPRYVLFAVGYRNRFGFPKPSVVARYRAIGAGLFESAASGAIRFRLEAGKPARASEYRQQGRRYWHH